MMALFYANLIQFDAVHQEFNPDFIVAFLNVIYILMIQFLPEAGLLKDFVFRSQLQLSAILTSVSKIKVQL